MSAGISAAREALRQAEADVNFRLAALREGVAVLLREQIAQRLAEMLPPAAAVELEIMECYTQGEFETTFRAHLYTVILPDGTEVWREDMLDFTARTVDGVLRELSPQFTELYRLVGDNAFERSPNDPGLARLDVR